MRRLILSVLTGTVLCGQSVFEAERFFEQLLTSPPASEVPAEALLRIVRPLETAPAPDVARVLSVASKGLTHRSESIRAASQS